MAAKLYLGQECQACKAGRKTIVCSVNKKYCMIACILVCCVLCVFVYLCMRMWCVCVCVSSTVIVIVFLE